MSDYDTLPLNTYNWTEWTEWDNTTWKSAHFFRFFIGDCKFILPLDESVLTVLSHALTYYTDNGAKISRVGDCILCFSFISDKDKIKELITDLSVNLENNKLTMQILLMELEEEDLPMVHFMEYSKQVLGS
ncbi:hypothetical protein [Vibrio fluvialis]|uniref:hypothetical protein n=1 Tax=Vibrio fluvialis TaxID=676 RepID=UPI001404E1DA|nr:hypothetical protein [Vibrio fluvialis]MBY8243000.1 hypothetical protein [Vibrio fluvialis]NHN71468.1 hypothetical protein [Vibrio fluvialis]